MMNETPLLQDNVEFLHDRVEFLSGKTKWLEGKVETLKKRMVIIPTVDRPIKNAHKSTFAVLVCDDTPVDCDFEMLLDMIFKHPDVCGNYRSYLYNFKNHFVLEIKTLGGAVMYRISLVRTKTDGVFGILSWFGSPSDRSGADTSLPPYGPIPTVNLKGLSFIATIHPLYTTDKITRNGSTAEVNMVRDLSSDDEDTEEEESDGGED
jgi:hypothetical protein